MMKEIRGKGMSGSAQKSYRVRAVHCDYRASDEEIYQALRRATDPLERSWEKLSKARRIAIKFNQDWPVNRLVTHEGHLQQLVSVQLMRAITRLLRERTTAELVCIDIGVESVWANISDGSATHALEALREYDVPFVECHHQPVEWRSVPGGGLMFEHYPVPVPFLEADELVDVQKFKNHNFMGITLCLKNLFGLMPQNAAGRPRMYYHHLVRMPYMLADLGRIYNPALNILDGMVTQAGGEWGPGNHPRICNTIAAGDHVIATDACGAHLMGHDPQADWLTPPYYRDRNALKIAAESGFGTVNLDEIDFESEMPAPIGEFFPNITDPQPLVVSWLKTMAEQGLYYRDHRAELLEKYADQYILMQMNEVKVTSPDGYFRVSRRELAGAHPEQAMFIKKVTAEEAEGEHFEVYERTLEMIRGKGL
jgi:uncharacterized protein (DUF362 family)